jgi:peptide deformylase
MKFKIIQNEQTPKVVDCEYTAQELIAEKKKLMTKFVSFAMRQKNCAGLAANQVSVDGERIMERFFAIKDKNGWELIIHPHIKEYIGTPYNTVEGCLTWIGRDLSVKRYNVIQVSYYNLKWELIEKKLSGYPSQVFQHEYDHLNGVEEN